MRAHGEGADSVTHSQVTALNSLQQLDKKRISRKGDSRRSAAAGAGGGRGAQTGGSEALEAFHSGQGPLRGSASLGFGPPEGRPQSTLQPKPGAARGKARRPDQNLGKGRPLGASGPLHRPPRALLRLTFLSGFWISGRMTQKGLMTSRNLTLGGETRGESGLGGPAPPRGVGARGRVGFPARGAGSRPRPCCPEGLTPHGGGCSAPGLAPAGSRSGSAAAGPALERRASPRDTSVLAPRRPLPLPLPATRRARAHRPRRDHNSRHAAGPRGLSGVRPEGGARRGARRERGVRLRSWTRVLGPGRRSPRRLVAPRFGAAVVRFAE